MIWKNLIWNYTVRLWYLWKYRNSLFPNYHNSKRIVTKKQKQNLLEKFREAFRNTKINDIPMSKFYGVHINEETDQKTNI